MTSSLWREPRAVLGFLADAGGGASRDCPPFGSCRRDGLDRGSRRLRRNVSFDGQKLQPAAREHIAAGGRSRARFFSRKRHMTAGSGTSFQPTEAA
jgi:hypothetical protein